MTGYLLRWEINIDADSPKEAAEQARAYQQNPAAQVGVFDVFAEDGTCTRVDLDEPENSGPTAEVVDLVAALRASVEAAKKRREALAAKASPTLCLVGQMNGEPHEPHDWWYTSAGGGHQLSSDDPTEKHVKRHWCPGIAEEGGTGE